MDFVAQLPTELSFFVFSPFSAEELCKISQVNKSWNRLANENTLWEKLCQKENWSDDQCTNWKELFKRKCRAIQNWQNEQYTIDSIDVQKTSGHIQVWNSKFIVNTDEDVQLWDIPSKKCLLSKTFDGKLSDWFWLGKHGVYIYIILNGENATLNFWNMKLNQVKTIEAEKSEYVRCSNDFIGCIGQRLRVFDIHGNVKLEKKMDFNFIAVERVTNRFATINEDNTVHIYDIQSGNSNSFKINSKPSKGIFSGNNLSLWFDHDACIESYNVTDERKITEFDATFFTDVLLSTNNPNIIITHESKSFMVFNLETPTSSSVALSDMDIHTAWTLREFLILNSNRTIYVEMVNKKITSLFSLKCDEEITDLHGSEEYLVVNICGVCKIWQFTE